MREAEQPGGGAGTGAPLRRPEKFRGIRPRCRAQYPGLLRRGRGSCRRTTASCAALRRHHGLSPAAFDALLRVSEGTAAQNGPAEDAGLVRPVQPATVDLLLSDGMLVPEPGGEGAGPGVRLSPLGRERLAAAGATHDDLLGHLLILLGDDATVVTDALARVARAARPRP